MSDTSALWWWAEIVLMAKCVFLIKFRFSELFLTLSWKNWSFWSHWGTEYMKALLTVYQRTVCFILSKIYISFSLSHPHPPSGTHYQCANTSTTEPYLWDITFYNEQARNVRFLWYDSVIIWNAHQLRFKWAQTGIDMSAVPRSRSYELLGFFFFGILYCFLQRKIVFENKSLNCPDTRPSQEKLSTLIQRPTRS
jgi:hypothetical protein